MRCPARYRTRSANSWSRSRHCRKTDTCRSVLEDGGMVEATFATPSDVDHPQAGYGEGVPLTSLTAAVEHITANCLADTPVGLVGLELEAHCFDVADPTRRPGWQEICDVIKSAPDPPCGSRITVEPGGAVELSTP